MEGAVEERIEDYEYMKPKYNIPIVYQDLRAPETYLQIFDSLELLERTASEIFTKILSRVAEERGKLGALTARIASAESKVERISGSTKATVVMSPYKYPAPTHLLDYEPLFGTYHPLDAPKRSRYHLTDFPHLQGAAGDPLSDRPYLPQSAGSDRRGEPVTTDARDGLGRVPDQISSIAGLLLFNSLETPYKTYVTLDNLLGEVREQAPEGKAELTAAPVTVAEGEELVNPQLVSYGYRPVLEDVPEFDLPDMLPDLGMVADIHWSASDGLDAIAPSMASHTRGASSSSASSSASVAHSSSSSSSSTAAAAAAADLPEFSARDGQSSGAAPALPSLDAGAAAAVPKEVAAPEAGRSSLLDDIRKGHKGRLKNAENRELKDAPPSVSGKNAAKPPPKNTVDIFSDLMQNLARRRQGMKGESEPKKPSKKSEGGAIRMPDATNDDGGAAEEEKEPSNDSDWEV